MFNTSKYTKWYFSIISKAKVRNTRRREEYEEHHIIPKCCGGDNNKENLVFLTLREHFICHLLLPHMTIVPDHRRRLFYALNYFKKSFTSNMFITYRKRQAKTMSEMIWINDTKKNKRIHPDILSEYPGWIRGRIKGRWTRTQSEAAKQSISTKNKGRLAGGKNFFAKKLLYNETVYGSVKDAIRSTGLSRKSLLKNGAVYL